MAIYSKGALGALRGSIGHVTASRWKKLNVARNKPAKHKGEPSKAQHAQRIKFGIISNFLAGMSEVIAIGYKTRKGKQIPLNLAAKALLETGITGTYPNYKLDYPKISLTRRSFHIDRATTPSITAKTGNRIKVSWALDPYPNLNTWPSDSAYIVLYNEGLKHYVVYSDIQRKSLGIEKTLPRMFAGETMHCWLFFESADKKLVSPTDYLGEVTLISV